MHSCYCLCFLYFSGIGWYWIMVVVLAVVLDGWGWVGQLTYCPACIGMDVIINWRWSIVSFCSCL